MIREQHKIALQEEIIDYDTYKLKPNKMQEEFICNIHDLIERGAKRALLISATGERVIIVTGRRNAVNKRVSVA